MNLFGFIPKKESFERAKNFIMANPSLSHTEYLRLFAKKYGKKMDARKFAELLVYMFEVVKDED